MNLNPLAWPLRAQYFTGSIVCVALLAFAYYVQFDLGIEPCPLCIFQRIAFIFMALFFMAGAVHNPRPVARRTYALLIAFAAAAGIGLASYHLWVQQQPPDPLAGCVPGWNYYVENFSLRYAWSKTLEHAFTGHADCAQVNWTWLGLSMPFWTLVCYLLLGAGAVWAGFRQRR